jgi:hypothetical protein
LQLLSQGAIIAILLLGGIFASVLGVVLVVLYKQMISRHMRGVAAIGQTGTQEGHARRKPLSPLIYSIENLDRSQPAAHRLRASLDSMFWPGAIYSVAAVIFGIVATCLLFAFSRTEFLPLRAACVIWAYAWPLVITLSLLWSSDRRRQLAVVTFYAGVIVLFCLWSVFTDSRPSSIATVTFPAFANPIVLWAIYAAPSIFLLLFLNRTVRAVGPVLLIFGSLVFLGWHLATVALGTSVGMRVAEWLFASTEIGAGTLWLGVIGAGLAIGAAFGWLAITGVADAYAARRVSDQMLIVDSIWFLQTLMLCSSLAFEVGYWGATGIFAFAAYKTVTVLGFRIFSAGLGRQPLRLLLLRVFGFSRRSSRLMDLIAAPGVTSAIFALSLRRI